MKFSLGGTGVLAIAALVIGAIGLWYLYTKRSAVISAFNPADQKNLANQAVTGLVTEATGREETLGGWLADMFNPAAQQVNQLYGKP